MYQLKEGDIVFIAGDLISLNCPSGYVISPTDFYSEEEILFYRQIDSDIFGRREKELEIFKKGPFRESDEYAVMTARQPWAVVKLFLKPSHAFDASHFFWLESAAYEIFEKTEDIRAARLVLKYYLIHMRDEKRRYEKEEMRAYPVDFKEFFFDIHPKLQGVVGWPEKF